MARFSRTALVSVLAGCTVLMVGCGSSGGGKAAGGSGNGGANAGGTSTGGASTGGSGGAGTCDDSGLTLPIDRGTSFVLEFGDSHFEVDPAKGARVTSFSVGGTELLMGSDVNALNYGSTFWTSPQSQWNWPPPPNLDDSAYTMSVVCTSIVGVSAPVTFGTTTYVVTKRYTPNVAKGAIDIEFSVQNTGTAAITLAPWEITRVAPNGITFFPSGEVYTTTQLMNQDQGGITWMDYAAAIGTGTGTGKKLFADGTGGWLAHAGNGLLLVKTFTDVDKASQAPGEGEIEMYLDAAYEEVENQGIYAPIEAGASATWSVTWYLKAIPTGTDVSVGSTALSDLVTNTIQ
jgi:hypothetical protein